MYAIRADAEELPVFACTVFVRIQTNNPYLSVRYSCVCDEYPVFAFTVFVRLRMNSPCLRVHFSYVCLRIARVCVYVIRRCVLIALVCMKGIREDADE